MTFLVDNQLPKALARFLGEQGFEAKHVYDSGMDEAKDELVWRQACESDMILISKDEDFIHLANRLGEKGRLVWVRIGNCRKQYLLDAFAEALPEMVDAFAGGARIVELR